MNAKPNAHRTYPPELEVQYTCEWILPKYNTNNDIKELTRLMSRL